MQNYVFYNPSQIEIRYIKNWKKIFMYRKAVTSEMHF